MPKFLLSFLLISSFVSANTLIECRVVTEEFTECDPYTERYIYAKEIRYSENRKKLINVKSFPAAEKTPSMKVISVKDVAQRYTPPKESLRYKGIDSVLYEPTVTYEVTKPVKKKLTKSLEESALRH